MTHVRRRGIDRTFVNWGQGAAIAFILFAIIIVFSLFQRFVMRDARPCRAAAASPPGREIDHHDVRTAVGRPG